MPRGDRTGPRRLGSMTGRRLGYCVGYDTPGYTKGPGMGLGRGSGFGYGRSCSWGYSAPIYAPVYNPFPSGIIPQISPENQLAMLNQEKGYLESEMKNMQSAIEDISKRISDFEKEK